MAFSSGTNLFSFFQSRMMDVVNFNSYQNIQTSGIMRGSQNENALGRISGVNDIICGSSYCGSYEEPTWQYCWRRRVDV